ncbi:S-type pyocin domain-containing protein [Pseudomonas sp. Q11]|uniref:S-type pyocin domain-containing protein n=1 Tax=Pseudomonas sp. Q11 TaxID=2968470 RepID=UPI00210ED5B3|nr:S-type pyocin domain-containing protein [Pseudomonas sp. Q11]MCQ6256856.1 S-type pyocin domain-containing protein [Pseudomonas sp. Q11]
MSDVGEGFVPGQPYHIKPTFIAGEQPVVFETGGGGGYIGNGNGWGLQEGPRRGEGPGRTIRPITFPNVMSEFMNEHKANKLAIDTEYSPIFKTLRADVERALAQKQQAAKVSKGSPIASVKSDQKITLDLIASKQTQYISKRPVALSLYKTNPLYLMKDLPSAKIRNMLNNAPFTPEIYLATYKAIDDAYKAALDLKILSMSIRLLSGKLEGYAKKSNDAEVAYRYNDETWAALLSQRLIVIESEKNIHVQLLADFLQKEVIAASGSVKGLAPAQSLLHHKATLDRMIKIKQGAVKSYVRPNPNISSPLSKPELEALKDLVDLQLKPKFGKRWQDYHRALLNSEAAKHLVVTSAAFGALAARAKEVTDEQARLAAKIKAQRSAAERTRIEAEARAKQMADEQARKKSEVEAKKIADKSAEQARRIAEANALKAAHTFKVSDFRTTQLNAAAGSISIAAGSSLTLEAAIQAGIRGLKSLGGVLLDRATGVGIGLLLYSSPLGNGDLYPPTTLSLPAEDLIPDLPGNLPALAAAGGTVEVPYRIYGDHSTYSVVATQADGGVSPKVPVRALTLDPVSNAYTFSTADTPPITLTFPIAAPGNSSTTTSGQPAKTPAYTGVTLTPIEVIAEHLPAVDQLDIRDAIYVFPLDAGLKPIYAVFSEPLDSGGFTRKQLDKKYKHAADFGVSDAKKNTETLTRFRDAIEAHLADKETIEKGTYLRKSGSKVFFNQKTNNVVVIDKEGNFSTGWRLDPNTPQFWNYIKNGGLQ